MGYDTVRLIEHLPNQRPDALDVPDAIFVRPTVMVVFDAVKDEMIVVTPVYPQAARRCADAAYARRAWSGCAASLPRSTSRCRTPPPWPASSWPCRTPVSNTSPPSSRTWCERAKEYIAAGDVFQVVLSQRFSAPFTLPPFALYRALRRTNPSPFLFHLDFGDFRPRRLQPRDPGARARRRGHDPSARRHAPPRRHAGGGQGAGAELLADPKERAEHLMLLDLGRNDVGRVARIGTVRVTDSFAVERYSHVMHIVSHRGGRAGSQHDVIDALMAGFPAGTLSGAPKVRAMEIIDELEKDKRGPYGGCVGYFSADGEMDSCIVLRTALVKDGVVHVQAGAGIVADSHPEAEQLECELQGQGPVQGRRGSRALRRTCQARQQIGRRNCRSCQARFGCDFRVVSSSDVARSAGSRRQLRHFDRRRS